MSKNVSDGSVQLASTIASPHEPALGCASTAQPQLAIAPKGNRSGLEAAPCRVIPGGRSRTAHAQREDHHDRDQRDEHQ
jgi:hypothetical protein